MTDLTRLSDLITARFAGLVLYARQFVDGDIADDVVQTALVALLSQRKAPAEPVAWMYRAVRNAAIDAARAKARRRRREQSVAADRSGWFEPSMGQAMDAASAEAALRRLPADFREVVVLRLWGDLRFADIADILNVSVSTAHSRYTTALEQVKHLMGSSLEQRCKTTTTSKQD